MTSNAPRRPRLRRTLPLVVLFITICVATLVFSSTRTSEAKFNGRGDNQSPLAATTNNRPPEIDVRGAYGVPKGTAQRAPLQSQLKTIGSLQTKAGVTLQVQYNGLTATPRHVFSYAG